MVLRRCPRCQSSVEVPAHRPPACPRCGFGAGPAAPAPPPAPGASVDADAGIPRFLPWLVGGLLVSIAAGGALWLGQDASSTLASEDASLQAADAAAAMAALSEQVRTGAGGLGRYLWTIPREPVLEEPSLRFEVAWPAEDHLYVHFHVEAGAASYSSTAIRELHCLPDRMVFVQPMVDERFAHATHMPARECVAQAFNTSGHADVFPQNHLLPWLGGLEPRALEPLDGGRHRAVYEGTFHYVWPGRQVAPGATPNLFEGENFEVHAEATFDAEGRVTQIDLVHDTVHGPPVASRMNFTWEPPEVPAPPEEPARVAPRLTARSYWMGSNLTWNTGLFTQAGYLADFEVLVLERGTRLATFRLDGGPQEAAGMRFEPIDGGDGLWHHGDGFRLDATGHVGQLRWHLHDTWSEESVDEGYRNF